jgi:hypothetical protein
LCNILKHSRFLLFADKTKIVHDVISPNTFLCSRLTLILYGVGEHVIS